MFSTNAGVARPDRKPLVSSMRWSTAFFILVFASFWMSLKSGMGFPPSSFWSAFVFDECADVVAGDDPGDRTGLLHVEDDDGQALLHAEGHGGQIHDREAFLEDLHVGKPIIARRGRILLGIAGVDTIHLGGLEHHV